MDCPKCTHEFEVIKFNDVEIDRCTGCFGIWFDELEQDDLRRLQGAADVDVGDEFVGAKYDKVRDVRCPRCNVPLFHVLHKGSTDITFERCSDCRGSFFDAGEFRDYMDEELFEEFKALFDGLDE
jgi:Zn-finger nucleic acid-binding protein